MTINTGTWAALTGIAAALVPLGAFALWAWRYVKRFAALFNHEVRLTKLENSVATKTQLDSLGTELRRLHDEHKAEDAEAFRNLNADVAAVREHMAKADDLRRVETKLDQLLIDGFGRARRT